MSAPRLALAVALLAAGCRASETQLAIRFEGACEAQKDLSCVNYLQFTLEDEKGFSTECIKATQSLSTLCDVAALADGRELFRSDPDALVRVEVKGMRVFPATSCDVQNACPPRVIFSGVTEERRASDLAGSPFPLTIKLVEPCGAKEQFWPGATNCAAICGAGNVVCDGISGGCLCRR